jgi:hypothetical protein
MKRFSAGLMVLVLLVAAVCVADQLPIPITEKIAPGTAEVVYAGNTFVFTTSVKLTAKFQFFLPNRIEIRVSSQYTGTEGPDPVSSATVSIYWQDGDETLYNGAPPTSEWTGLVLTEGGLTEK